VLFCIGILLLSPVYWFVCALASWSGPEDDIAIIYLLAVPIVFHGFITGKYGFMQATKSALIFFTFIAALCVVRHFELAGRGGYSSRMANRCLESLAWSVPWFLGSLSFSILRKAIDPGIKKTESGPRE
jgi:hypothetical protein